MMPDLKEASIDDLGLMIHVWTRLKEMEVNTVGDLLAHESELRPYLPDLLEGIQRLKRGHDQPVEV